MPCKYIHFGYFFVCKLFYFLVLLRADEPDEEGAVQPGQPILNQANYLDQDRLEFVQSYLQMAEDTRSMTTETSDSGMPGTHGAPSEIGMEETTGKAIVVVPTWNLFCLALSTRGDFLNSAEDKYSGYPQGIINKGNYKFLLHPGLHP